MIATLVLFFLISGVVLSNYHKQVFVQHSTVTQMVYKDNSSQKTFFWTCFRSCSRNGRCLGYVLESCTKGLSQCNGLARESDDPGFTPLTASSNKLWVKQCPEGYESIPTDSVPPICYRLHTAGVNVTEAQEICLKTGGAESHLLTLETVAEFHAVKTAMMKWLSGKKQYLCCCILNWHLETFSNLASFILPN